MYLNLCENQVGYSAEGLGFPSVSACHAIVFRYAKGLFGIHSAGGEQGAFLRGKAKAFGDFVHNFDITDRGTGVALYSVLNNFNRYRSDDDWKTEIVAYATAVSFRGDVYRYRVTDHIGRDAHGREDSIYVDFRLESGEVRACYKAWRKMQEQREEASIVDPRNLSKIRNRGVPGAPSLQLEPTTIFPPDQSAAPYSKTAPVVAGADSSGKMHSISKWDTLRIY